MVCKLLAACQLQDKPLRLDTAAFGGTGAVLRGYRRASLITAQDTVQSPAVLVAWKVRRVSGVQTGAREARTARGSEPAHASTASAAAGTYAQAPSASSQHLRSSAGR